MKTCHAIRFLKFEDLGNWEELIRNKYQLEYLEFGVDELLIAKNSNLLFILGGPIGAKDQEDFTLLKKVKEIINHRYQNNLKTVGICLGAQLMAVELGGDIFTPENKHEIGWLPITLNNEKIEMFHWHGDHIKLPPKGEILASSELCQVQIFKVGKSFIGFQCHPEFNPNNIEQWLIGHINELKNKNIDIHSLRRETEDNKDFKKISKTLFNKLIS